MVIVDDLSSFLRMEKTATCTTKKVVARTLLWCCSVIGVPRVWVSDTAKHIKNSALRLVAEQLGVDAAFRW